MIRKTMHHLRRHTSWAADALGLSDSVARTRTVARFAKKHDLIFFRSKNAFVAQITVIRGVTSSTSQNDTNMCIGTHDGYDIALVERSMTLKYPQANNTHHRWYVMQFDLRKHTDLPFVFIGTSTEPKQLYAKVFQTHRQVQHIDIAEHKHVAKNFAAHFSVIASPAEQLFLSRLLNREITEKMTHTRQPYAIEIEGDSLYLMTAASMSSVQSLGKMMHYGLWLAQHVDKLKV